MDGVSLGGRDRSMEFAFGASDCTHMSLEAENHDQAHVFERSPGEPATARQSRDPDDRHADRHEPGG